MELYTVEGYLTDLPPRRLQLYGFLSSQKQLSYLFTSVSILETSLSLGKMVLPALMVNGKPTIDEVFEALYLILYGCSVLIITEAWQRGEEKLSETPNKQKIR